MKSDQQGDYEVQIKIRNGRILSRVRAQGYESLAKFCQAHSLPYSEIVSLVGMTRPAILKDGQWRRSVISLAGALGILPEDLFTSRQMIGGAVSTIIRHVDEEQLIWLDGPEAQGLLTHQEPADEVLGRQRAINEFLEQLPPRQRRVLEARYGLSGQPSMTLEELADEFGTGRERIRQLEKEALRKAKNPRWQKLLKQYVDPDYNPDEMTKQKAEALVADLAAREAEKQRETAINALIHRGWWWEKVPPEIQTRWQQAPEGPEGNGEREQCVEAVIGLLRKDRGDYYLP